MRRREFLTASISAAGAAVTGRAWSAPAVDQRLLVVFLRGGYDALNVVVPTASDFYHEARPTIAIARPDPANPKAALALDADWGLHPALARSLYPLWQKGQIAFVPFAGTDDLTRSHFETQDTIELGQPAAGGRNYRSGFMARLADQLGQSRPIAFSSQPPLIFDGDRAVPNVDIGGIGKPGVDGRQADLIKRMYEGHDLASAVSTGFSVRDQAYASLSQAPDRRSIPASGFEGAARRVAGMLKAGYNIAFLDIGGWDTHVNQGATTGPLASQIGSLGQGLSRMAEDLSPDLWAKTVVVVVSEFGRTVRENGDKGTDHGHGSVYWLLGGSVNGGKMLGEQVRLTPDLLNQNRDLPVLNDYRVIIGNVLRTRYGLSAQSLATVFPRIDIPKLALV